MTKAQHREVVKYLVRHQVPRVKHEVFCQSKKTPEEIPSLQEDDVACEPPAQRRASTALVPAKNCRRAENRRAIIENAIEIFYEPV